MIICALSGGKASAYAAYLAVQKYGKDAVKLYFNDTKWEHADLYRFINDVSKFLEIPIIYDSDGRSPEQVFIDEAFLGNNRVPICSKILKANRLQRYYEDGDTLIFGIGPDEAHRAARLVGVYQTIAVKRQAFCRLEFPLIEGNVQKSTVDSWLTSVGIRIPLLYELGFLHNNCSGGCIRAGKRQWGHLLETLPDVYMARERFETEFRALTGKDVHILKDETLQELRERIESQGWLDYGTDDTEVNSECIGICSFIN